MRRESLSPLTLTIPAGHLKGGRIIVIVVPGGSGCAVDVDFNEYTYTHKKNTSPSCRRHVFAFLFLLENCPSFSHIYFFQSLFFNSISIFLPHSYLDQYQVFIKYSCVQSWPSAQDWQPCIRLMPSLLKVITTHNEHNNQHPTKIVLYHTRWRCQFFRKYRKMLPPLKKKSRFHWSCLLKYCWYPATQKIPVKQLDGRKIFERERESPFATCWGRAGEEGSCSRGVLPCLAQLSRMY